jgi:anti-sigma B factor antagonist
MSSKPEKKRIEAEQVDDVTVISFLLKKILDEQNIQAMGDQLFDLVQRENRRKVALTFRNVEYLSSAAIGKFIALRYILDRMGGYLVLCDVDPQIMEVFEITKLDKFFRMPRHLEDGVEALQVALSEQSIIACPVHGCPGEARATVKLAGQNTKFRCVDCKADVKLLLPDILPGGESAATVSGIHMETYPRQNSDDRFEYMELGAGTPHVLGVVGRLDLFTSAVFEKLWRSLPSPRQVLVDCSDTWDCTDRGVQVAVGLLTGGADEDRTVVLVKDRTVQPWNALPPEVAVCTGKPEALRLLDDPPTSAHCPLTARVYRPADSTPP